MIRQLLQKMEERLTSEGAKTTLADYIKLLQIQREMAEDEPREIRVKWIDPETTAESENGE